MKPFKNPRDGTLINPAHIVWIALQTDDGDQPYVEIKLSTGGSFYSKRMPLEQAQALLAEYEARFAEALAG